MPNTESTPKVLPFRREDAPDRLFDTSDHAMAERFGARTRQLLRDGKDVKETARLAFSYADRVLKSQYLPDAIDAHLTALGLVYVGQSGGIQ